MNKHNDIIIIGAGIAGLLLAQKLKGQGIETLILEKSRGVGGRIATRRIEDLGFDHGASYVPTYSECLDVVEKAQLTHKMKFTPAGVFFDGGMNQLPKSLAANLTIIREQRVLKISRSDDLWTLQTESQDTFTAKKIILTAPLPQAFELLKANGLSSTYDREISFVEYRKCLMGLFAVDRPLDNLFEHLTSSPSFLFMKERSLHPRGLVVHASDYFAENHYDLPDEELLPIIKTYAQDYLGTAFQTTASELKRWRFGLPKRVLPYPFLEYAESLFLIGDAFQNPGIQGSVLSAIALSRSL
jgi:renalase